MGTRATAKWLARLAKKVQPKPAFDVEAFLGRDDDATSREYMLERAREVPEYQERTRRFLDECSQGLFQLYCDGRWTSGNSWYKGYRSAVRMAMEELDLRDPESLKPAASKLLHSVKNHPAALRVVRMAYGKVMYEYMIAPSPLDTEWTYESE